MASSATIAGVIAVALAAAAGYALGDVRLPSVPFFRSNNALHAAPVSATEKCDIKGNVSIETGERIYHLPGQKFYDQTIIRPEYGEQWFCSEAEARKAGWRKSRR